MTAAEALTASAAVSIAGRSNSTGRSRRGGRSRSRQTRNAVISPNIFLSHYRKETWGDPENFRPERFLGESPSAYNWFPFGGGIRRCIGASFALYEMRAVIQTIARRVDMRLERDVPERIVRRAITFAPGKDVPVIVRDAAPRADAQSEQREPVSAI